MSGTATRTSSQPASSSSLIWRSVAATSRVSLHVMDCTTTGAPPPTVTPPMLMALLLRRGINLSGCLH